MMKYNFRNVRVLCFATSVSAKLVCFVKEKTAVRIWNGRCFEPQRCEMKLFRDNGLIFLREVCALWQEGKHLDVRFLCQDGQIEGHRLFLAAASPLLASFIRDPLHEEGPVELVLPDVSVSVLVQGLKCLYGGRNAFLQPKHLAVLKLLGVEVERWFDSPVSIKQELADVSNEEEVEADLVEDVEVVTPHNDGLKPVDGGWQCSACNHFASRKNFFQNHLCHHVNSSLLAVEIPHFICMGCMNQCEDFGSFLGHLEACEQGRKVTFSCDPCQKVFYDEQSKIFHDMVHRKDFSCFYCNQRLDSANSYLSHWLTSHQTRSVSYPCNFCHSTFDSDPTLQKHVLVHQTPPQYACLHCDRVFSAKSSFAYHSRKHVNPVFKCSLCPKSFKSMRGLKYHSNLHQGVADYLCDDCGRGFITKQKLINHRRAKHTFEKPYICEQCGQGFTRSDKLLLHKRRFHTKEKRYHCDICDWRGVDSSSLIHHQKKHKKKASATASLS